MTDEQLIREIKAWAKNGESLAAEAWLICEPETEAKGYFEGSIHTCEDVIKLIRRLKRKQKKDKGVETYG